MREALTRVSLVGLVNMGRMLASMLRESARTNLTFLSPGPEMAERTAAPWRSR